MTEAHRLTIRGSEPHGWAHVVELDGRQLMCSEVSFSMTATGRAEATIKLPAVILDVETNAVTSVVGAFALKSPEAKEGGL